MAFRTETAKSASPDRIGLGRAIFSRLRAERVNSSTPKTTGNLPLSAASGQAESTTQCELGKEVPLGTGGLQAGVLESGAYRSLVTGDAGG